MPFKDKDKHREYQREYQARWRKENPESTKKTKKISASKSYNKYREEIKWRVIEKRYGVTLEQYKEMFENQNGCCAVCGRHQSDFKRSLSVDHNHENGKTRSLLCGNCNTALGHVKDNIGILEKLINYLKRHNG